MKKRQVDKKKEWHKPAYESLKFSQTLGGSKDKWAESVTHAHHTGAIS
jgi:hypothetical protein